MSFCTNCGAQINDDARFCSACGHASKVNNTSDTKTTDLQSAPDFQAPTEAPIPAPDFKAAPKSKNEEAAVSQRYIEQATPQAAVPPDKSAQPVAPPPLNYAPAQATVPVEDPPIPQSPPPAPQNVTPAPTPSPIYSKPRKKHRLPWILRFLIANIIIAAVLLGLWICAGNMVTLYFHSEDVLETLNSGSLDLSGTENPYAELPNYIKDMLDDETLTKRNGPITDAVLPYIKVERVKINGFLTSSSVEYAVTAPDLELWIKNLDESATASEETMLAALNDYVKGAPRRTANVTVEYHRAHLFSIDWQGNYFTTEFADAICGGFNTGYNAVYEDAMKELEELFK